MLLRRNVGFVKQNITTIITETNKVEISLPDSVSHTLNIKEFWGKTNITHSTKQSLCFVTDSLRGES
jgi:hypothetical protein